MTNKMMMIMIMMVVVMMMMKITANFLKQVLYVGEDKTSGKQKWKYSWYLKDKVFRDTWYMSCCNLSQSWWMEGGNDKGQKRGEGTEMNARCKTKVIWQISAWEVLSPLGGPKKFWEERWQGPSLDTKQPCLLIPTLDIQ